MKTIFLSAGIPDLKKGGNRLYFDTADLTAIRDAVLALVYVCMKLSIRIVWGGHPAITPIVYEAIRNYEEKELESHDSLTDDQLKEYIQNHVHLFQSKWYEIFFPKDNNRFENVTLIEKYDTESDSLKIMRETMLKSAYISAAIYIGGMEGIIDEDELLYEFYPHCLTFPIASTGGAALCLYEKHKSERGYTSDLLTNYAYTSLFYSILKSI